MKGRGSQDSSTNQPHPVGIDSRNRLGVDAHPSEQGGADVAIVRPFVGVAGIVEGSSGSALVPAVAHWPRSRLEISANSEQRALGWSKYVKFRKCKLDQRNVGRMGRLLGGARLRGDAE